MDLLSNRGPDLQTNFEIQNGNLMIDMFSSVLHMRGDAVQRQPMTNDLYCLQWNGEIFDGISIDREKSDTSVLFESLTLDPDSIHSVLSKVKGPWAIVILDLKRRSIYFGRDCLGRRSLLLHKRINADGIKFQLSSVFLGSNDEHWEEVQYGYLHRVDLAELELGAFNCESRKLSIFDIPPINTMMSSEEEILDILHSFDSLLRMAVSRRLPTRSCNIMSVLFSGGLDCTVITCLLSILAPPNLQIELVNVSFANDTTSFTPSDRLLARNVFQELTLRFPQRKFNFVEVDVSKEEYQKARSHIKTLLHPSDNVMDLSIGCALWFACSGVALDSKIIFTGAGADELFAGYSRHKTTFQTHSWHGLAAELQKEIMHIGYRNLGRDDRIISDFGKEARWPYLDEDFVAFSCKLPVDLKLRTVPERGVINKFILREYASAILGLPEWIANTPKKAIQFGSNSFRIDGKSKSGYDQI